jgi:plasmid stabilization system protein ParE
MPEETVKWSKPAERQYIAAIEYILNDSVQNAENLERKLSDKIKLVSVLPETCPPDKYKINNDGRYRAFTLFNYKVSYRIEGNTIRILRFRHTKMKAKYY